MRELIPALNNALKVNSRAKTFAAAAESVKLAKADLDAVYGFWKKGSGIEHFIEKGSPAWVGMMLATKPYYRDLQNARPASAAPRKSCWSQWRELNEPMH